MAKEIVTFVTVEDDHDEDRTYGFSSNNVIDESKVVEAEIIDSTEQKISKRRGPGRPPKDGANVITYTNFDDDGKKKSSGKGSVVKEFEKGYADNSKLLYGAIAQTEMIYNSIEDELNHFRSNRTYGGKMRLQHMSNFMNTQVTVLNTKIAAVRELNSTRNKINDLVLKREQQLKDVKDENSDKVITDAYYALLNAPRYGLPTVGQALAPQSINTGVNLSGNIIETASVGSGVAPTTVNMSDIVPANANNIIPANNEDQAFNDYIGNLTPVQRKMISEKDPNIQTVVIYNQATGTKYFDVVNVQTGQSVPGIQRPGEFLLDDMRIDQRNGRAVNSNANMSFPLVIVGSRAMDEL